MIVVVVTVMMVVAADKKSTHVGQDVEGDQRAPDDLGQQDVAFGRFFLAHLFFRDFQQLLGRQSRFFFAKDLVSTHAKHAKGETGQEDAKAAHFSLPDVMMSAVG